MAEEEEGKSKRKTELQTKLITKISDTISAVNTATCVDQVILALHSLSSLLFPVDFSSLSGVISEQYRHQLNNSDAPSVGERNELWEAFYRGVAFPTFARFLIYDVASNWLSCIPLTARKLVYDIFFLKGLATEVLQTLLPCLERNAPDVQSSDAVISNAERLIELCLLENEGVLHLARELGSYHEPQNGSSSLIKLTVSRVSQLVASVPDKARMGAPKSLSSHLYFKNVTVQLLEGAREESLKIKNEDLSSITNLGGTFQFVAEIFSRICRRGSADLLVREMISQILVHVQSLLSYSSNTVEECLKSDPRIQFWFLMMGIIKDTYTVERMAEEILRQLAAEPATGQEAFWILWTLFHRSFEHQTTIRLMFLEKFLLWKVFPHCCLRWILQFAVFGCPPDSDKLKKGDNDNGLLDAIRRLIALWSKQEFVQSAPLEQQMYVTAAAGLLLENMSREELDSTKDVMQSILQGVSYRLENPDEMVRKMASNIALVFSMIVDPQNPLYLDEDSYRGETIDWEFGLATQSKGALAATNTISNKDNESYSKPVETKLNLGDINEGGSNAIARKKKYLEYKEVDPDEIIDPAALDDELLSGDEDDNASEDSEASSDSSLQPYDLTDDDSDLKKKISQLVDVVGALRKSDDPDGVERALDISEKLVRASPEELQHGASELVRTLIQVRCSDTAVEGEEEPAEDKRQRALVALLVTCPFESVEAMHKLLYSPHLDVSQRIMILDVMTDAAEELAKTKTIIQKNQSSPMITSTGPQPWFLPSSQGPPGAESWREVSESSTPLSWTNRYERNIPSKPGQINKGKTRRWGNRPATVQANEAEWSLNKFPLYAAAFMLPAMQGFDKKRQGVDLLGRDFIVLGKLIYMLGVCMRCTALHPEAFALAPPLLDMLSSREVCHHKEAYVRRSVLFAASCLLAALHPSFIASALAEGNLVVSRGLDWVRTWALEVASSDTDRDCYTLAMACLQLHAEMAFQASRALESTEGTVGQKNVGLPSDITKGVIRIPGSSSSFISEL